MKYLFIVFAFINSGGGLAFTQDSNGAQAGGSGPVYAAKDVDKKAIIFERIEPGYTEEAQTRKIEGVVLLGAVLAADGRVAEVAVINGLAGGLTENALDAAKKIKFTPAVKDGSRVSVRVKLAYYFVLPGGSYYGDSSKKAYYKYGCHRGIEPTAFVVFKSREEAEASGYKKADCP